MLIGIKDVQLFFSNKTCSPVSSDVRPYIVHLQSELLYFFLLRTDLHNYNGIRSNQGHREPPQVAITFYLARILHMALFLFCFIWVNESKLHRRLRTISNHIFYFRKLGNETV